MFDFLKKNIFIIALSTITLFIGFLTFLTFLDRSFIELNQKNLQILLISNIFLLVLLFIFIFNEIKKSIKNDIDKDGLKSNKKYITYFSLFTLTPSILISIFSLFLFTFALEKYFDQKVTTVVNNSYKLAQSYVQEVRNKVEADIILVAFDTNKSAKFLNDNKNEYSRFLKTQKLIRKVDEIHIIDKNKKLLFSTLNENENFIAPVDKALNLVLDDDRPLKIINASAKSKRFSKKIPKQFYNYKNKEIIDHSIEKSLNSNLFKKIIIVTNQLNHFKKKKYPRNVVIIKGGKERYNSSVLALKYIKRYKPKNVFIHDAARPNFSIKLLKSIKKNLKKNKAVIPILKSKDTIKYKTKNQIFNLNRNNLLLTQTPQAFRFKELYNLSIKQKNNITDEATLFINQNYRLKFIPGENQNNKITYLDDIKTSKTYFGLGFDIHKLVKNKKLYLGGIKIPFHSGLEGHSDGDVILHAITDAILGATRKKDIGTYFPNTKKFRNIRSQKILKPVINNLYKNSFSINNLDINLICEQPKVSKYRDKIINSISKLTTLNKDKINLKGKTVEKLGLIGKEKAIACEVIISITEYD